MENAHILKAGLTNVFHERLCQPSAGSVTCATVAGRPPRQHLNQHTALVSWRELGGIACCLWTPGQLDKDKASLPWPLP